MHLELLSPAKNLEQGKAAIDHGADAVYIGAPMFGARVAAGNSIEEIEELAKYAHLFGSKVFVTVNTLLFDKELEEAERMIWTLYNAGIDAVIIQDMGLLELDIPPIELHASTQTHNIDTERIKFLEQVGFSRIILARETSLEQMSVLRRETHVDLETFVQGALCVCYSGQCYMSLYLSDKRALRSGNRGSCSQPCRSRYNLENEEGKLLKKDEHLLSLKDFSAAQQIENMIDAGITSFKIEGRLKDVSYVKNVTAYYRKLIDSIIERRSGSKASLQRSSSGRTHFYFEPDLERTFNRGFTDYFLRSRQKMASPTTQKSMGKQVGKVVWSKGNQLIVKTFEPLTAGDGICFFNATQQLEGFMVNRVEGERITINKELTIKEETLLWRNNDYIFEKKLQGESAERKIAVDMTLTECKEGLLLKLCDEDGCESEMTMECQKEAARDAEKANATIERQLRKTGGTAFTIRKLNIDLNRALFIPSATLNELRRKAVELLAEERIRHFHPKDKVLVPNNIPYHEKQLDYRANVVNSKSEEFYRKHGVVEIERGLDETLDFKGKSLMTTKYCLRYELGQCLQHKCNKEVANDYAKSLFLLNNGRRFKLEFDCKKCEMTIKL